MFYNKLMNIKKAFFILLLILMATSFLSSQAKYRGQRVQENSEDGVILSAHAKKTDNGIQIDIFFSEPVNPASFVGKNVLINSKPLSSETRTVFNREGTQVRFLVRAEFPVELKIEGVKTSTGNTVAEKKITLGN